MNEPLLLVAILLAPVVLYLLVKVVSAAYFSAKMDYTKRMIRHADTETHKDRI